MLCMCYRTAVWTRFQKTLFIDTTLKMCLVGTRKNTGISFWLIIVVALLIVRIAYISRTEMVLGIPAVTDPAPLMFRICGEGIRTFIATQYKAVQDFAVTLKKQRKIMEEIDRFFVIVIL